MSEPTIDLRSDTLSMPTEEMLLSIQTADLGDDSRDGDPTVVELEALAAEMMGMEAGLLNPSGTMSNLVAMRTHVEPGATAIVEQSAHLYGAEIGGIASACGLLVLPVPGSYGAMNLDQLEFAARKVPGLFPIAPNDLRCRPAAVKACTLKFRESATRISPDAVTAMWVG